MKPQVNRAKRVISGVADVVEEKLSDLDLKRVVPTTAVGSFVAAVPLMLKDLPVVAKSLANRTGDIDPSKLFDLIPDGVKLMQESVMDFIETHDVSHIISVKNAPAKAGDVDNVIFEVASLNRARGADNMTATEFSAAEFNSTIIGIERGLEAAVGSVSRGVLFGALLEIPVTCIENALHVKNNRKSVEDACVDAAKDVGIRAGSAGVAAAAFTGLGLLGVSLAPVVVPLAIVGSAMYTWSATGRVWKALDDDTKERFVNSDTVVMLCKHKARYLADRNPA